MVSPGRVGEMLSSQMAREEPPKGEGEVRGHGTKAEM